MRPGKYVPKHHSDSGIDRGPGHHRRNPPMIDLTVVVGEQDPLRSRLPYGNILRVRVALAPLVSVADARIGQHGRKGLSRRSILGLIDDEDIELGIRLRQNRSNGPLDGRGPVERADRHGGRHLERHL